MLTNVGKQGIGSYQSHKAHWGGAETRECLWIISPHSTSGALLTDSLIQLRIEKNDLNVTCGENAIYVYDGLPDLTGSTQQSQLLAVFCTQDGTPRVVEGRNGHITVHYKQGREGQGFNAMYTVHSCSSGTCYPPRVCNDKDRCVCAEGYTGTSCVVEKCPNKCSEELQHGICDKGYGRCICFPGFGGADCSIKIRQENAVFQELFNSRLLTDNLEHLRKTLPRFGHSLITDKRGSLWMFGGYSLSHGPLNDIRQFDTKNNTWIQVTVDSTAEAKLPQGRYFHAAEIVQSKQAIYIYGGLTGKGKGNSNDILGGFWKFGLQIQRWDEVIMEDVRPPPSAGHTLTLIKNLDRESLLLIGGFSVDKGLHSSIWEYDLQNDQWEKLSTSGAGPVGIYGHSSVYHPQSQIVYVFGGYEYFGNITGMSNRLYALHYPAMSWSELPKFNELNRPDDFLPRARALHSAINTENYMILFGGRTYPHNSSDVLVAYVYKCNQWIRLTEDIEIVGKIPSPTYAQAMTLDHENGAVYVVGGWDGSSQSRVARINLPTDLCELWSSGKFLCRHFLGCSYCSIKPVQEFSSRCYSNGNTDVCQGNGTFVFNNGISCDDSWIAKRNCSSFTNCASCLASWPSHSEKSSVCQWCENCEENSQCLPAGNDCNTNKDDKCSSTISVVDQCPSLNCAAADCESCMLLESCSWTERNKSLRCLSNEQIDKENLTVLVTCPVRCNSYTNCSSCLTAATAEGIYILFFHFYGNTLKNSYLVNRSDF